MLNKIFTAFIALVLVAGISLAGTARKGPKAPPPMRVGETEATLAPGVSGGAPARSVLSPGDSIGFTYYDYGTNGSANHNVIVFADNDDIAVGRMGADDPATNNRGSYYWFSTNNGTTWTPQGPRVETARKGWTNIAQFVDFGGTEVLTSHVAGFFNVDASRGANIWQQTQSNQVGIWPKMAIGSGAYIHVVAGAQPNGDPVGYTRSTDGGTTFNPLDALIFAGTGVVGDADGYDIAAQGSNVAAVHAAGPGGDIVLARSTNNGDTWTTQVIYDVNPNLPLGQQQFQPDGSCAVVYDNAGNIHVTWGNWLGIGNDSAVTEFFSSISAPIMYWSAAAGIKNIALPTQDTSIRVPTEARDGNFATQPDIGVDASNNLYVIFAQLISERDDSLNNYEHVYALKSTDGGATWGAAVDVTPGTDFDATFPSLGDRVENDLCIVYNSDPIAGNFLSGNHAQISVAIKFLKVPVSFLPPAGVREVGGLPTAYTLEQNYPNPFNPSTEIRYSLPSRSNVELTIYNLLGEKIAELVNEGQGAGNYVATWDGRNAQGQTVASGVYFYKLSAGNYLSTKKMLLLK